MFSNDAAKDDQIRVVLWHAAGDSFSAGNDVEDFLKNPPEPGEAPQARLMNVLINLDKPLVAAVQGAAIGGGTTMLTHCDFVYAGETARFQMPFIVLGLVSEFGSSFLGSGAHRTPPCGRDDPVRSAFRCPRAAEIGLVTCVVPDQGLLETATETAQVLAQKPIGALRACQRLIKLPSREQIEQAVKVEGEEFALRVRSAEAREAFSAFLEKRPPNFAKTGESATAK